MNTPNPAPDNPFKQLLVPLALSLILGMFILYGGEAYQTIGLEALKNTITISSYVLGIAEFWILAVLVQRVVHYIVLEKFVAKAFGIQIPRLLTQLSAAIIYLSAIAAIIGVVFKKDLTFVVAASGALSVVVGLALKNLILDLFSGLAMNLDQVIKIGDCIQLHKAGDQVIEGEVREISWRTTRIFDNTGNTIIIPNSQVSSWTITNFSAPQPFFETVVTIILDTEIPVERAKHILHSAAIEISPNFSVPDAPSPMVGIRNITLQGIEYAVLIYPTFKTRARARNLVQQRILHHLHYAGLAPATQKQGIMKVQAEHANFIKPSIPHLAVLLGSTELFQDLAESELQLLATSAHLQQFPIHTRIVQGGEVATSMFLIIEGILSAQSWRKKIGKKFLTEKGILLSPGYLIGGYAMLAGESYDATLLSESDILLCEIDHMAIEKLFTQKPNSARQLSQRIAIQLNAQIASGEISRYQKASGDHSIENLTTDIFKNLQRSFAHLKLS